MKSIFRCAAVVLIAAINSACSPSFSDADIDNVKQSIRDEFSKRPGVTVVDVQMMKQSPQKLMGLLKIKISLLGDQEITRSCTADMGDKGQYIWKCE